MFDFIVVGSGPAGACLTSRLAKTKKAPKVLLLEAGSASDTSNPNILAERWTSFMQYPSNNWGYKTVPQQHADGRVIDYSRGKGLGGSTAINFCAYTVGPADDYDRWAAEMGDEAFDWEHAIRYRKNIESFDNEFSPKHPKWATPDMSVHGVDGPVRIEYPKVVETPMTTQLEAAEELGLVLNPDINSGNPIGISSVPASSRKGRRITAAVAYLSDVPDNLKIVDQAQVTRIIFEGKRAVGVVANGTEYRASQDVVLSAGAVDSPKILMLSGVGDRVDLAQLGIDVFHHLPGVGKNLEDHYFVPALWRQKDGLNTWSAFHTDPAAVKTAYEQFHKDGTGPLSVMYQGMIMGFFKADEVLYTEEYADLPKHIQEHIRKPTVPLWELCTFVPPFSPSADPKHTYLTAVIFLHGSQSRGTIKLASADPKDAPLVNPNFFSHPFDKVCGIAAAKRLLEYVEAPLIKKDIIEPFMAPASRLDEDLLAYWRANGGSTWHPSCTVKMGKADDPDACLDGDFRVRGLEHLRVVDMSATPFLPNCHTQAIAYFIGECAAVKMIDEYGLDT